MINLDQVMSWGLWGVWGLGMLAVGWGVGRHVERVRMQLASRDLGRTVTDGWFNLVQTYRPGARLQSHEHAPVRRGDAVMAHAKTTPKPGAKTAATSHATAVPAPRSLWEYTIVALGNSLERQMEQLSRMGELGWELVSIIAPGPPHGGLSLAYLKRPVHG